MNARKIVPVLIFVSLIIGFSSFFCEKAHDQVQRDWGLKIASCPAHCGNDLRETIPSYHIVAVSGSLDLEELDKLILELPGWDYTASVDANGKTYAYFYNTSVVELMGRAYVVTDSKKLFARPPFAADFRAKRFDFTLLSAHTHFGNNAQSSMLSEWFKAFKSNNGPEQDLILLGDLDFPNESQWIPMLPHSKGMLNNIWIRSQHTSEFTGEMGAVENGAVWGTFHMNRDDDPNLF